MAKGRGGLRWTGLAVWSLILAGGLAPQQAHARVAKTAVDIDTTPQGAQVIRVQPSGETEIGVTPVHGHRLPRGEVTLRIVRAGYEDVLETVRIGSKSQSFVFNLVRESRPAVIDLTGGPEAVGASVEIDGAAVGTMPMSREVTAGRHHVAVRRDGYGTWERWVEASEGQKLSFEIRLTAQATPTGGLRVTSQPTGATVLVAGTSRGVTPLLLKNLHPSDYGVEVRMQGHGAYHQVVQVRAGETASVAARLAVVATAPPASVAGGTGTLQVTANAKGAEVWIAGQRVGKVPLKIARAPGAITLEIKAAGRQSTTRHVNVVAGKVVSVHVDLVAAQGPAGETGSGEVRVVASESGATASLDGGPPSPTPHIFPGVSAGTHFVTVEAEGFAEWRGSVTVQPNLRAEVVADLAKSGRLEITARGAVEAEVFLDGELAGRTPMVKSVAAGTYKITVKRASDGKVEERSIAMGADDTVRFQATWGEAKRSRVRHRAMPYSAQPIDKGYGSLDLHVGWPYLVGARISGGLVDDIDLGFTWRNSAKAINDFEFRGKMLIARTRAFAVAVEGGLGFGLGSEDRNSVNARVRGLVSVMMSERAAVTLRAALNLFSDSAAPVAEGESEGDRRSGVQILPGVAIEARIGKFWNLHLLFEAEPFTDGREILEDDGQLLGMDMNTGFRGVAGFSLLF
jgi:hypothetical protein